MNATATLKKGNSQPKKDAETKMESPPVCGVLIRKATVAPFAGPFALEAQTRGDDPTGAQRQWQPEDGGPNHAPAAG
jgi:hypothetical protein